MNISDDEFIARFEDCSLASESFHHRDHVRMAYLYLCRYPALEAVQRFSSALARFAEAKGKPTLYHETITWAFLFLIRERLARTGHTQRWSEFAESNADLMNWETMSSGNTTAMRHWHRIWPSTRSYFRTKSARRASCLITSPVPLQLRSHKPELR